MGYNLTEPKKDLISKLVQAVRRQELPEEFVVSWLYGGGCIPEYRATEPGAEPLTVSKGALDALEKAGLIIATPDYKTETKISGSSKKPTATQQATEKSRRCTLTGKAYEVVDSNFDAPDTSYLTQLTPLADTTSLDPELAERLQALRVGGDDPKVWDAGVRSATVLLEERIRAAAAFSDRTRTGVPLVNDVFGNNGVLAHAFRDASERQAYRDLYAGVVGVFRNDYGHRFVDPSPEDGGALIVFLNLLLKMTRDLEREETSEAE